MRGKMDLNLKEYLERVRTVCPLVHHITNYVTVNDCANITLAAGASPVMADDPREAADMTALSQALVINIGTLNERTVSSMLASGKKANECGIPVIFDPVGCGATAFRTETAKKILEGIRVSVMRGNISEIGCLCGLGSSAKGVDASAEDTEIDAVKTAKMAARLYHCVAVITGEEDVVTDGDKTVLIANGCAEMAKITGTGCMCTSVIASFCGASPANLREAAAAGTAFMGLCGELAERNAGMHGLGSFRAAIFDAAGQMTGAMLEKGAKYHEAGN